MKVALYARVSSEAQDTDLSLSAQLRALRDYCIKNGHDIVYEFVDEAESGRTASRPEFKKMIALAKATPPSFEAILVWKLNRFARSRVDSITYKMLLQKKGIKVISINEPIEDSPTGHLLEGMIESIDEFYSANLGQDIRRGMRENALRGFFNGSKPPYGLRKVAVKDGQKTRGRLEPEAEDSVAVRTIKRMFALAGTGLGCKEIAVTVNREGYPSAGGKRWGKTTVHKVLTNEAYCGNLVWSGRPGCPAVKRGESVRVENAWPGIVNKDVFRMVQQQMRGRLQHKLHPRQVPSKYLLSGFLFCRCGKAMVGHSAKSGRHFYYQCSTRSKQGIDACCQSALPKEKLEGRVMSQLKATVLTDENLEKLVVLVNEGIRSSSKTMIGRLEIINAELNDVRTRLTKLYETLETGKLSLDDLAPRIRELRTRQDVLSKGRVLAEAEKVAQGYEELDTAVVKAYARDLRSTLEEVEVSQRKAFLRSFIDRIEVEKDKAVMRYRLPVPGALQSATVLPLETSGGAEGIRTPDPLNANQMLSH